MNVTELISKLKEMPGHLEVLFPCGTSEVIVEELEINESIMPLGIKYLLLNELNEPLKEPLKEINKEEESLLTPDERKEFMTEAIKEQPLTNEDTEKHGGIRQKMNEETNNRILKLINQGYNYNKIGEEIGCSTSHVSRLAKKHGIKKPKKITIEKTIMLKNSNITFTKKKRGRPKKEKNKRTGKAKLQKDFNSYNVRCRKCGIPKPSTEYKGTWRVCKSCRKRKKK